MCQRSALGAHTRATRNAGQLLEILDAECDALIANVGLHFGWTAEFVRHAKAVVDVLAKRHRPELGRVGIWRETTPQHFYSGEGPEAWRYAGDFHRWNSSRLLAKRAVPMSLEHGFGCFPYRSDQPFTRSIDEGNHAGARARHEVISYCEKMQVPRMQVRQALVSRFDAHLEHCVEGAKMLDCTHWCSAIMPVYDEELMRVMKELT